MDNTCADTLWQQIRISLPPNAFAPDLRRCLRVLPHVVLLLGGSTAAALLLVPWPVAVLLSLLIGNAYASVFFFGHEVGHGSVAKRLWLRELILYGTMLIFLVSPRFWRIWHNQIHHGYTNEEQRDPDNFGTLNDFCRYRATRWAVRLAPGGGRLLGILALFTGFTLHAQGVLWVKSRRLPGFERIQRWRGAVDSAAMLGFWIALSVLVGGRVSLYVVWLPMLVANAVIMSYIFTNHLLRPLRASNDPLETSMSVRTMRLLDWLHFNFSHHVEHHMFPTISSEYAPHVRAKLQQLAKERYLSPSHWQALMMLFRTPRVHVARDRLFDPWRGTSIEIRAVEGALRSGGHLDAGGAACGEPACDDCGARDVP
jgi:fatty acid desaturase